MAPAALGGVVVRWHFGFGHEDEEFFDVALDASAQFALDSRRVVPEGLAEGQSCRSKASWAVRRRLAWG